MTPPPLYQVPSRKDALNQVASCSKHYHGVILRGSCGVGKKVLIETLLERPECFLESPSRVKPNPIRVVRLRMNAVLQHSKDDFSDAFVGWLCCAIIEHLPELEPEAIHRELSQCLTNEKRLDALFRGVLSRLNGKALVLVLEDWEYSVDPAPLAFFRDRLSRAVCGHEPWQNLYLLLTSVVSLQEDTARVSPLEHALGGPILLDDLSLDELRMLLPMDLLQLSPDHHEYLHRITGGVPGLIEEVLRCWYSDRRFRLHFEEKRERALEHALEHHIIKARTRLKARGLMGHFKRLQARAAGWEQMRAFPQEADLDMEAAIGRQLTIIGVAAESWHGRYRPRAGLFEDIGAT